jgi:Ca2+-transporting ATPase
MASPPKDKWHALSADQVLQKLDSSSRGLSTEEAAIRYKTFGPNELEEGEKLSKLDILIEQAKILSLLFSAWRRSSPSWLTNS